MTFQTPSGFTQIDTDSGTATITNTKPNTSIVGDNGITTSASGNAVTVDGTDIGIEFVETQVVTSPTSVSSVEFINLPSQSTFLFIFERIQPATAGAHLTLEFSTDNGSTWDTSGYSGGLNHSPFNSTTLTNENSTSNIPLTGPLSLTETSGSGDLKIMELRGPNPPRLMGQVQFRNDSTEINRIGYFGGVGSSISSNAFRVLMNTGDIALGRFSLYTFTRIPPT